MRVNIRGRVLSLPTVAYTRFVEQTRTFPKWKEPLSRRHENGRRKKSEAAFIQQLKSDDKPIQGLPETGKPSQPKVEPHNTRDEDDHRIGG